MENKKIRVLFLASWYPSRVDKVLGMFVKRKAEAVSAKCDVAVLYVRMDESMTKTKYDLEFIKENEIFTVKVYFKSTGKGIIKKFFYNIRFIKAYILGLKYINKNWGCYDLIHVNVVDRAGYVAFWLKLIKKIKYVITEHSTPDLKYLRGETNYTKIPLLFFKKIIVKNAEYINVDSTASLNYWKKAGLKGNFGIIPNVVDVYPEFINFNREKKDNIKRAVHISVLIERKNVADIIRAYAHIYNNLNIKDIEFHIIGKGEQKEMLTKLAEELQVLNKCVFFHGFVTEEEKMNLLLNSDFHILNSDEEGFSVVTAEAILYGIPVIATKCGGPEDFVPKEVGLLIEIRNLNQLINAILYMIDNSDKYDKQNMFEFGRNKFSPQIICQQTYDVYKKALKL